MTAVIPSVCKFDNEKYQCNGCDKTFTLDQVHKKWRCPECQKVIDIYAVNGKTKVVINRIEPTALKAKAYIYLTKYVHLGPYEVKSVETLQNGKVKAMIIGNGPVEFTHVQYVNRHEGGWS
ncbi:hypothetical protein L1D37_13575 [Vibrio sp. Isolate33]|uniref:hypothetical protein n=1 Tax=Vibrio sp. Isolate33 TaxID=2908539 RepID=UPI001EFC5ABA|nr:hypothetical protein [Vibrio sp. Isolate33]MCG9544796.1 hypothetical protein [Vibrio sp. Isolate33]